MEKRKIRITPHARERIRERIPDVDRNRIVEYVSNARYKGQTIRQLEINEPKKATEIKRRFKHDNSTQIRLYNGNVFVFSGDGGKARTLVTVVNL